MAENQQPIVTSYPAGIYNNETGAWGYDKWMLFRVMNGRHILRTRGGLDAEGEKPVDGAPQLCLYLPPSALESELNLEWQEGAYGIGLGAGLQSFMDQGGTRANISNAFTNVISGQVPANRTIENIGSALADGTIGFIADAGLELIGKVIKDPAQKIGGIFGQIPNPRTDIFFTSVKYRTHSFTWKLIPRNVAEAQAIDKILNTFQFYSLPSFGEEGDGESGFFMGLPYEWSVQMFSEGPGRGKHHINTIDRSVVTSVTINHATNDRVAFIVDGEMSYYPVDTTLTVEMQEVRLQGRNDQDVIWRGLKDPSSNERANSKDNSVKADYPDPNTPKNVTSTEVVSFVKETGQKIFDILKTPPNEGGG